LPDLTQQFEQILQTAEAADASLGEDLWLIAERILLFRLTRAGEQKRVELASMVHLIRKIISDTIGQEKLSPELVKMDELASNEFKGSADANLSLVFTEIVDMAENMNSQQLYHLISALRKLELPPQEAAVIERLDRAEEFLSESIDQENDWEI
jgi:hypothetical protein